MVAVLEVGIDGFMVSRVGRKVLCRAFQASGSCFKLFNFGP